uniref:MPN domain-containing protein n=1 Tax=Spongospora subterranea TaxID=70186 RepID=A0A0H5RD27_9EUKA|eukprot:CRZ11502.1 hypothetical protein [Spongospora subterranea]
MRWAEFKVKLQKTADLNQTGQVPLRSLWNIAHQAIILGAQHYSQGSPEHAYIYYMRAVNILVKIAPKHQQYSRESSSEQSKYRAIAIEVLDKLEEITGLLQEKWDAPTPPCPISPTNQPPEPVPVPISPPDPSPSPVDDPCIELAPGDRPIAPPLSPVQEGGDLEDPFANLRMSYPKSRPPIQSAEPAGTSKQMAILASIGELCRVNIPGDTPWQFLRAVEDNTRRDIETCGMLMGCMIDREYHITHVYLPKQKGTANTVEAQDDLEYLNFSIDNNLLQLGWIHTHPSQSCFLSSVDLHTHFGFQRDLKEAIAIVMAPSVKDNIGFFSLTDKGLRIVQNCHKAGFHEHSQNEGLYESSRHTIIRDRSKITIVDQRNF